VTAAVCVTFDNMGNAAAVGEGRADGPDEGEPGLAVGYPRLLDLLDRLDLRATFFVEGWNGVHHPARVAELAQRGHEVGLHGWVHERWGELDAAEVRSLLHRGTEALRGAGVEPVGFRSPGGSRGPHTAPLLAELGYRFDASLPEEGEPRAPHLLAEGIAQVPFDWHGVDGFYYLALHPDDPEAPVHLEAGFGELLDRAIAHDGFATLICHAFLSAVDDARFAALTRVLERVVADPALRPVTAGGAAAEVLGRSR
jgi:peptidoglycan/xylan/chitin deacetylase (PgdA/CDA1 family)